LEVILGFLTFTGQPDGGGQAAGSAWIPTAARDVSARTSVNIGVWRSPSRCGRHLVLNPERRGRAASVAIALSRAFGIC
jgi:hypothetical protein